MYKCVSVHMGCICVCAHMCTVTPEIQIYILKWETDLSTSKKPSGHAGIHVIRQFVVCTHMRMCAPHCSRKPVSVYIKNG